MTVRVFLLSETCSDAHTCLVPNDQHGEERLSSSVMRMILLLRPVLRSIVVDLLSDSDANTETKAVKKVKTTEYHA